MNRSQLVKRLTDLEENVSSEINLIKLELKHTKDIDDNIIDEKPIVLIIGHSKESGGATNKKYNISEYKFNSDLVTQIDKLLNIMYFKRNIIIVERQGYISLPERINKLNPFFAISFHANAFNEKATGTEMLYYYKSEISKHLASILQKNISKVLGLKNRGIKSKKEKDRGGYLLKKVNCPIVIAEPFFIDNVNDYDIVKNKLHELITAYANSIVEFNYILENQNE